MERFADVVISLPIDGVFTYEVPDHLKGACTVGTRVLAPFGKRSVTGYIVALKKDAAVKGIKPIIDVLDASPLFDEKRLKFFKWLSSYYLSPPGEVFSLMHPSSENIKSFRHFFLTEKGKHFLDNPGRPPSKEDSLAHDVLKAVGRGITLASLQRKLKKRAIHSTIEGLKKEGLIGEEARINPGAKGRVERFASVRAGCNTREASWKIKRFSLQEKVLEYLKKNGETPVTLLRKNMGSIDGALKRLDKKGMVTIAEREVLRSPLKDTSPRPLDHELNAEQEKAVEIILKNAGGGFSPHLLYGVTGSGKTIVYIKVIEKVVSSGKKALFLVPEIILTERVSAYLSAKFPGRVALLHSALSEGERYDEWQRIRRGEVDCVIGARSALFSPLKDLGVIIVDEEHDPSYKGEAGVRYNARDAAMMLASIIGIPVILGSATPSLETFYNVKTGKITPVYLKKRVSGAAMPEIELLDMRGVKGTFLSERLISLMKEAIEKGGQVLLFLNRRGFSNFLLCGDCGHTVKCVNCSVTLTMHKRAGCLKCHYCDFSMPIPRGCPKCAGHNLKDPGVGTERVEEEVRRLFPKSGVARLDRDTSRKKGSARKIIDAVEERRVDILVGTQMVSKGHHFPGITLVGIISGDTSLNIPDFRGAERTFQLISQASGRAGRGGDEGGGDRSKVIVQTLNPGHFSFESARKHDYEGFFEEELKSREEAHFPPFFRLAQLRVEGIKEEKVVEAVTSIKNIAEKLSKGSGDVIVLGPAPCLIERLNGNFRRQMLFKSRHASKLNKFMTLLKKGFEGTIPRGVNVVIDIDPSAAV
ncbi:MAG: primosomal protein N' [Deltaproteobacteria bacterium]|nr:primosomal protein N' [Deltaproteobacteria bacterium]